MIIEVVKNWFYLQPIKTSDLIQIITVIATLILIYITIRYNKKTLNLITNPPDKMKIDTSVCGQSEKGLHLNVVIDNYSNNDLIVKGIALSFSSYFNQYRYRPISYYISLVRVNHEKYNDASVTKENGRTVFVLAVAKSLEEEGDFMENRRKENADFNKSLEEGGMGYKINSTLNGFKEFKDIYIKQDKFIWLRIRKFYFNNWKERFFVDALDIVVECKGCRPFYQKIDKMAKKKIYKWLINSKK